MAVSLNHQTLPNLYCDEAANDVVSWEADEVNESDKILTISSLDSNHCFVDYVNDSLSNLFDSEVGMLESKALSSSFHDLPNDIVRARQEAIQWMLKVHCFYRFRPETAYLSINYMDRFLSARALPQGKGWPMQLLSPKTVQRMELVVMKTLKWRLRTITPFDFVHYFIAKVSKTQRQNSLCNLYSSASDLIINSCKAIDSLNYPPSAIAAAVALWLTNHSVDDQTLGSLHNRLNQINYTAMVKKIYKVIEGKGVVWR
ncbi:Heptahelical protein 4 isoform 1 [Hibiscus syriacus]|uniref:Heptahelical protein 4 isoform 1 n=1 Tax=Hibiscus syriacus TaxID=106335 RepID=A0A6A3BIA3_HIBSY|nr:Heptahelical protein 4 isoform 1 [Hibiscus syriacus]